LRNGFYLDLSFKWYGCPQKENGHALYSRFGTRIRRRLRRQRPALAGCVSQGDSRAAALANIREAIELYVEDCRDAGDPVPNEVGKEFVEVEAA